MLWQDMIRPNVVTACSSIHPSSGEENCVKITPIEGLLGRSGVKILLDMVTQVRFVARFARLFMSFINHW